jgi:hypothetical protein
MTAGDPRRTLDPLAMELPDPESLQRIVRSFAHLRAAHGEGIGRPPMVQPTGAFFPDEFRGDGPSVARLLKKMIDLAPLSSEIGVELAFAMPDEERAGGCGSLACGSSSEGAASAGSSVEELADHYCVVVSTNDVANADVLATSLARSIGALVLLETDEPVSAEEGELAAVACGFGVLLLNGAAVWAKSCGGLRMARATSLSVEEIAVALALFAAVHGYRPSEARRHLGATQRAAFETAQDWVDSNPWLIDSLRDAPHRLQTGDLDLEPVRGILGQWWHRRKLERALRAPSSRPPSLLTEARRRRIEEIEALLDEDPARAPASEG